MKFLKLLLKNLLLLIEHLNLKVIPVSAFLNTGIYVLKNLYFRLKRSEMTDIVFKNNSHKNVFEMTNLISALLQCNLKKYLLPIIFTSGFLISCSSSKEFSEYKNVTGELIESGVASWYGPNFHGKKTANGERFDQNELTAAHRTLPFNSIVRVVNTSNKNSVIVRINDRGPYAKNRIIDLSKKAAEKIDMIDNGTTKVKLFLLNKITVPSNLKQPYYTVQIGSFKKRNDAESLSSKFPDSEVVKISIKGEIYYRVYVGNFISKNKAKKLLYKLMQKGIDGFVKQVEN